MTEQKQPSKLVLLIEKSGYLLDSRILAKLLNYEHRIIAQAIRRNIQRLEKKSSLIRRESTRKREIGGTIEVFYMLTDRQCLILLDTLKKGEEKDTYHDFLVDAFLEAKQRVNDLEKQLEIVQSKDDKWNKFAASSIIDHYALDLAIKNAPTESMRQTFIKERSKLLQEKGHEIAQNLLGNGEKKQIED